jgi:dienelactone hydrolase
MRVLCFLFSVVAVVFCMGSVQAQPVPENAMFLSGDTLRRGCIYKPQGKGPFPAIVYIQASSKPSIEQGDTTTPFLELAKAYTSKGYVLFVPGRRVGDGSFAEKKGKEDINQLFMDAIKFHEQDIEAGLVWLKAQSCVDESRIVLTGHSSGAIQALMLAEKDTGARGIIAFSPGAKVWSENVLLRDALQKAVKGSKIPIFLIQPQNDFGLGPVHDLGPELARKGSPNRSKIFLPHGNSQPEANAFAFNAPAVWKADVFAFLDEVLR